MNANVRLEVFGRLDDIFIRVRDAVDAENDEAYLVDLHTQTASEVDEYAARLIFLVGGSSDGAVDSPPSVMNRGHRTLFRWVGDQVAAARSAFKTKDMDMFLRNMRGIRAAMRRTLALLSDATEIDSSQDASLVQTGRSPSWHTFERKQAKTDDDAVSAGASAGTQLAAVPQAPEDVPTLVTANVHVEVGVAERCQGRLNEAMAQFKKALEMQRAAPGDTHPDIGATLYQMGTIHMERGGWDEAMALFEETLTLQRAALGEMHLDVALTLHRWVVSSSSAAILIWPCDSLWRHWPSDALPSVTPTWMFRRHFKMWEKPTTLFATGMMPMMLFRRHVRYCMRRQARSPSILPLPR